MTRKHMGGEDMNEMTQCPECGDYHPNCDRAGYCPVEEPDGRPEETADMTHEPSRAYIFEARTADGTLKDRFSFYGPFSAGFELATKRGALYDAPYIGHYETA